MRKDRPEISAIIAVFGNYLGLYSGGVEALVSTISRNNTRACPMALS